MRKRAGALLLVAAVLAGTTTPAQGDGGVLVLRPFALPERTAWAPEGPRAEFVDDDPVLGDRTLWRGPHGDSSNSDEITGVLAPVFHKDWVVDTDLYFPSSGSVDRAGNLYASPLWPGDDLMLVAYDAQDGHRRFTIEGNAGASGGNVPFLTEDPSQPGREILFVAQRGEAIAVTTDGDVLWRQPSGLAVPDPADPVTAHELGEYISFGPNYSPSVDGLFAVTGDGYIVGYDRRTGRTLLDSPFRLPGAPSPVGPPIVLPPAAQAYITNELLPLMPGRPNGAGLTEIVRVLLGQGVQVANYFAIDPRTGRFWVAATAPDESDGTLDGVSQNGALYGLDLVEDDHGSYRFVEACRTDFQGGSGTTPSLNGDGSRVYLADAVGNLLAIDRSCNQVWSFNVGSQIAGSPAVSQDNNEIYAIAGRNIAKITDAGDHADLVWLSTLDMYGVGPGQANFNLLTVGLAANGIMIQAGAGPVTVNPTTGVESRRPFNLGTGVLDRETGELRWFVEGPEESVATTPIGPDGSMYILHSPIRRAIARALFPTQTGPLLGGVSKYAPERFDLLVRDALCAAADRHRRATAIRHDDRDGARADRRQIGHLLDQASVAGPQAVADGDLTTEEWSYLSDLLTTARRTARFGIATSGEAFLDTACGFVPAIEVTIDILPGVDPNEARLRTLRDRIPVAIHGSEVLDVDVLDATALGFGPRRARPAATHIEDVNDDGHADLVAEFPISRSGVVVPGVQRPCVTGPNFVACDALVVRP